MALDTYLYAASTCVVCDGCAKAQAGSQVDIHLDTDLIPALPETVRGIIQLVDGLNYSIQYDTADLQGGATEITDAIVLDVGCVSTLKLSQEYVDAEYGDLPAKVDEAILELEAAVAANRSVETPGTSDEVSKSVTYAAPSIVVPPQTTGLLSIKIVDDIIDTINDPDVIKYEAGLHYTMEVKVAITNDLAYEEDGESYAEAIMIGVMSGLTSVITKYKFIAGEDTIVFYRIGEYFYASFDNNHNTGTKMLNATATLQTRTTKF